MAKNGTEFSKYAQAFHKVIDGKKTNNDIFTKDLLKMGLTDNDKAYIDGEFPNVIDENGERHIEGNKGDVLRKYYGGTNGLSKLIPKLETEFDEEFRERYCEELQDYDESRIMEFAQVLKIDVNEDDIDIVSEAIADYYSSLIKRATTKKKTKSKTSIDTSKTERHNLSLSYSITANEKTVIRNICGIINTGMHEMKDIAHELYVLLSIIHNNNEDNKWRIGLWRSVNKNQKLYNEKYNELQSHYTAVVNILKPKCALNTSIKSICDISENFCNNKYIFTKEDFNYTALETMQEEFETQYKSLLTYLDAV